MNILYIAKLRSCKVPNFLKMPSDPPADESFFTSLYVVFGILTILVITYVGSYIYFKKTILTSAMISLIATFITAVIFSKFTTRNSEDITVLSMSDLMVAVIGSILVFYVLMFVMYTAFMDERIIVKQVKRTE